MTTKTELLERLRESTERQEKLVWRNKDLEHQLEQLRTEHKALQHKELNRIAERFMAAQLANPHEDIAKTGRGLAEDSFYYARKFLEVAQQQALKDDEA